MTQRLARFIILFGLLLGLLGPPPLAAIESKSVLVLNSYHKGYKWTDDITDGIESVMEHGLSSLSRQVEYLYMDTKRNTSAEYYAFLHRVYAIKFRDRHFDVIIASDNNALNFLLDHRDSLFPGTPVVFCGINGFQPEQLRGQKGYTGVNEATDLPATLRLMWRLHPRTKHLLVVEDQTTTGQAMAGVVNQALSTLPRGVEVIRPRALSMPELQQRIIDLPEDSLVLYTLYIRDARGVVYEYDQSLSLLAEVSKVPIYGVWDFSLGDGIVGGRLASGFYQGKVAAELALRVLGGEPVDQIPVVMNSPNRYMFDDRQLERFGIRHNQLPPKSVLINTPDPRLRQMQLATVIIASVGLAAILLLTNNLRLRRRHRLALEEANRELEARVEDRTRELEAANTKLQQEMREREQAQSQIQELAFHDALTGLPNRNLFLDRLDQALARHRRYAEKGILLYLDLDGFKAINDSYGHNLGDEVLCATVQRLESQIRATDTLARWGGDEFLILMPETSRGLSTETIIARIQEAMELPLHVGDMELRVGLSLGVARYPLNGMDLDTLLQAADRNMYDDKVRRKKRKVL